PTMRRDTSLRMRGTGSVSAGRSVSFGALTFIRSWLRSGKDSGRGYRLKAIAYSLLAFFHLQPDSPVEATLLTGRQRPVPTWREIAELDRAVGQASQPIDLQTQGLAPAPHDPIATLLQGQVEDAAALFAWPHPHMVRLHRSTVDLDLLMHGLRDLAGGTTVHQGGIAARDAVPWVGEAMHRLAIGREQQEPGGHHVEPAHISEAGVIGNEIEDGAAAGFIACSGDHAQRLVKS